MDIETLLREAVTKKASDIYIIAGLSASFRRNGQLCHEYEQRLLPGDTRRLLEQLYHLAGDRNMEPLLQGGDDDFSFSIQGLSRFRVSAFKQRGSLSAVIRVIQFNLPDYRQLNIPDGVMDLTDNRQGMILVVGPAGSGKSTTLACLVDRINRTQQRHIITLEDPLEFLHSHNQSVVTQREIGVDTESYVKGLRAALRQSPDIILLGEMRDYETIEVAMTAAETGHLIFSTLHTIGAANTIERIVDVFPANQQRQIAVQLAMVLRAVVSQQLVPKKDGNGKNDESDEAIDSRIQAHFSAQEKRLEVQKDYYEKFKGVLTMRQVEQIYERPAFNARMMRPQGAPRQMAPHRR